MKAKEVYLCPICNKNIEVGEKCVRFKVFGVTSYLHPKCCESQKQKSY